MAAIFPKGFKQNATDMIVMLVQDGVPLKEAKKMVWELRQSGEINLNSLEQARRKVMK
jgi:translation initiation factor 2B subunit (eIF-2B alpha/beta/delta family)